jgi:hypothetical protein
MQGNERASERQFLSLRRSFQSGALPGLGEHSSVRFLVAILSLVLCGGSAFARFGEVRTLTGQTFQGHVRVTPGRIVIVNVDQSAIYNVESSNIARISFPAYPINEASNPSATEGVPRGWQESDIGAVRFLGSTRHEGNTFTIRSSGVNIDGNGDSFHYVFKPVTGDSEIIAQLSSIHYTHPDAKAGLMMRENLNEYSRNVMLALTAMRGAALQFRSTERDGTASLSLPRVFAPQWLKLRRRGNEFSAFTSPNGRVWSLVEKVTMAMSESFYVGMAVASANEGALNWTTFSRVRQASRIISEDFTPEVELTSGTTIFGRPDTANKDEITFAGVPKVLRVPTPRVSRISFQPLAGDLAWRTRASRPGVFVNNGDFFDGDFRSIGGGEVTISSVLYGLRSFEIDNEALAVVFQPRQWRPQPFEVETADGSVIRASEFTLGNGEIKVKEPALGEVRVPASELIELRRR